MIDLIKEITKYGPITIEVRNSYWRIGCMVQLPARIQESYVRVYEEHLYQGLKKLIALAKEENKKLWEIQRAPKQQTLNYGSENKDWKEIA